MTKGKTGAQKRKARTKRLGISRHQVDLMAGLPTTASRRRVKATRLGMTSASLRRIEEGPFDPIKRFDEEVALSIFKGNESIVRDWCKEVKWSRRLYGHIKSLRKDSRSPYLTEVGNALASLDFYDSGWSVLSRGHPLLGEPEETYSQEVRTRGAYSWKKYQDTLLGWDVRPDISERSKRIIDQAFMNIESAIPSCSDRHTVEESFKRMDNHKESGYPWMAPKCSTLSRRVRASMGMETLHEKYSDHPDQDKVDRWIEMQSELASTSESPLARVVDRISEINSGVMPEIVNVSGLRTEATTKEKDTKVRLVWEVPFDHVVIECMYLRSFMDNLMEVDSPFGNRYWAHSVRREQGWSKIRELIGLSQSFGTECISIDYTKFDKHISTYLLSKVVRILGKKIGLTDYEREYLLQGFARSKLITPWGVMERNGGVPSGSLATNLIDSIINAVTCEVIGIMHDCEVDYVVNGDDACLSTELKVSDRGLIEAGKVMGLVLNAKKQWRHPSAFIFNKSLWAEELGGQCPFMHRVYNSILRRDKRSELTPAEDLSAFYSKLEALTHHPYKEEFLDWILVNTTLDEVYHRWSPAAWEGLILPPAPGYNTPLDEKKWRAIEYYKRSWFWEQLFRYDKAD